MIIARTYDPQLVHSTLTRPDMWETIAEEGLEYEDFQPLVNSEIWLTVVHKQSLAGFYNLHARNGTTLVIHAHILPEHREDCAKESSKAVLQWILDNVPSNYMKVIAEIPVVYQNVVHFTMNAGFQEEGINRLSCVENGQLCDQVMLGITRDEITSFLRGEH
jgi:RimJ/RimL family protein N-acetyltransferase